MNLTRPNRVFRGAALLCMLLLAVAPLALCVALMTTCPGCAAAGLLAQAIPPTVEPNYKGFAGQSVAVMVWTDNGVHTDWPRIELDIANGIQSKLIQAQKAKTKEFEGTTFPVSPASVFRFQEEHPEFEAEPIANTAPKIGVSRLIYVEVKGFQTRSEQSIELFRGSVTALVKVMEVKDGKAKMAFEEGNIRVVFPAKSNEEGMPGLGDEKVYAGTLDAFTTELATRFVPHPGTD